MSLLRWLAIASEMMFISSSDADAPAVLELAYQYLTIMSVTLIILYALHVYRSAIQGMGNTIIPMIAGLLECVGRVSVALFLPRIVGEYGLFFAETTAWLLSAVCVMTAFYVTVHRLSASEREGEKSSDSKTGHPCTLT